MMAPMTGQDERLDQRRAFLDAMAQVPHAVSIVATDGPAGRDGVVVSALASVSADTPCPTILICLNRAGQVPGKLLANGVFSVNLLAEEQQDLAERFAGRSEVPRDAWFVPGAWQAAETGAPLLGAALAVFDCEVGQSSLVGTHHVIFGAVRAVRTNSGGKPLLHAQRRYRRLHD